jgi:tRNA pseudouridine38-40 synthase
VVSYDGTQFCGWQSQLIHKNKTSIQATLQNALTRIYKEPVHLVASGRTDSGVHASAQNVHFYLNSDPRRLPLLLALRTLLPPTICVRGAWLVPSEFCANKSAIAKTYRYYILNDNFPSALLARFSYWYKKQPLDIEVLQAYANLLVGRHDFKTFQSAGGTPPKTSHRRIYKAQWSQPKPNLFIFEITGNGFLRQMIRNLVATQINLHEKGHPPAEILRLLEQKNRRLIGKPAPPMGLFLSRVFYPNNLLQKGDPFGN